MKTSQTFVSVRREFKTYKTRIFGKLRTNLIINASLPSVICIIHSKNLIFRRKYGTSWSEVSFDDFPEPEVKTDAYKVFLKIRFYVQNANNAHEKKIIWRKHNNKHQNNHKKSRFMQMAKHFFFKLIHYYAYYVIVIDNCQWEKKCSKVSRKRSLLQFELNGAFNSKVFTYVLFFICQ